MCKVTQVIAAPTCTPPALERVIMATLSDTESAVLDSASDDYASLEFRSSRV